MSVLTYEMHPGGARFVGQHGGFAEASAALPPGSYTTLRTYGGRRVVRLREHLRRLERSAILQGRPGGLDEAGARRAVAAALDATGHPESRVRLTFSPPRLFVSVEPFTPLRPEVYTQGVACVTVDVRRDNPEAKDTRFIAAATDAYAHLPAGVEEGLLLGEEGEVLEGLSSNFLAVLDGVLRTEDAHALPGVTRALVLELAAMRLPVVRRAVRRDELPRLSEAFITSVSREVLPVVRIDGRPVGDGRVGPWTRRIMDGFAEAVRREAEPL